MAREFKGPVALFAVSLAAWLLFGCAAGRSVQHTVTGWFGAADAGPRPQARYAAAAGVRLHGAPDASSAVVGELGLHEGVLSQQREKGFAYVTSEKSGRSGWVRERELIERLPVERKPSVAAPTDSAEESAEPEEPPEPAEPPARPPEKSIFDPY